MGSRLLFLNKDRRQSDKLINSLDLVSTGAPLFPNSPGDIGRASLDSVVKRPKILDIQEIIQKRRILMKDYGVDSHK